MITVDDIPHTLFTSTPSSHTQSKDCCIINKTCEIAAQNWVIPREYTKIYSVVEA